MVNTELETYLKDTHKKLSGKVGACGVCVWLTGAAGRVDEQV